VDCWDQRLKIYLKVSGVAKMKFALFSVTEISKRKTNWIGHILR
jgi:hypothetical protein